MVYMQCTNSCVQRCGISIAAGIALIFAMIVFGVGLRLCELLREKRRRTRRARRRIRNIAHAKAWYDIFQRPHVKRLPNRLGD